MNKCEDCKYYVQHRSYDTGHCHFDPPKVIYAMGFQTVWPYVKNHDWCGKWKEMADEIRDE